MTEKNREDLIEQIQDTAKQIKRKRGVKQINEQRVKASNYDIATHLAVGLGKTIEAVLEVTGTKKPITRETIHNLLVPHDWQCIDPKTSPRAARRRFFAHNETLPAGPCFVLTPDRFAYMFDGYCYNVYQDERQGIWDVKLDALFKGGGQKQVVCYWVPADSTMTLWKNLLTDALQGRFRSTAKIGLKSRIKNMFVDCRIAQRN